MDDYINKKDAIAYVQNELMFTVISPDVIEAVIDRMFRNMDNYFCIHTAAVKNILNSKVRRAGIAFILNIDIRDFVRILNVYLDYLRLHDKWGLCS